MQRRNESPSLLRLSALRAVGVKRQSADDAACAAPLGKCCDSPHVLVEIARTEIGIRGDRILPERVAERHADAPVADIECRYHFHTQIIA